MKEWMEKHPKAAKWIREGGLFIIFSYVVTAIKALILIFLPTLYHNLVGDVEWLWPGIPVTLFGVDFKLSILGNALETAADGSFLVNSGLATVVVFLVMNLFTCVWNPVTVALIHNEALRNTISAIVTTVVTGGVSMVIIFIVDKTIFAPGWGQKKAD